MAQSARVIGRRRIKVGIVGSGLVGSTTAYTLIMRRIGREVVLVNRTLERARAEAADALRASTTELRCAMDELGLDGPSPECSG